MWWDHTHKASLKQPRKTGEDGDGTSEKMEDVDRRLGGTGTKLYPAGKPLSKQEAELARTHAPTDSKGKMKCWDAASHMGCKLKASQRSRSHEAIKERNLHWAVQAQLLRRGGLKT